MSNFFFLIAENPSVVHERACILLPLLVSLNWCWQGPLLKCGPRSTPGSRGGSLTIVVPVPSALSEIVNVLPSVTAILNLSVNLNRYHGDQ